MTTVLVFGLVLVVSNVLNFAVIYWHFKRENELIRRLASKNEAEYVKNYENDKKTPTTESPSREAMKRWKSGMKG